MRRVARLLLLLMTAWIVMTFTHEMGHIIGGVCCGGSLISADLRPWHLPYSIFEPDPYPLVTLWAGLIFGVLAPVAVAMIVQREWMWFIANFCILANGTYIAIAWLSGDRYLDTPKLLEHGASPISIAVYCLLTIAFGYVGFRRSCIVALAVPKPTNVNDSKTVDNPSDPPKSPIGSQFDS
ncbi:hypothetical protein SH501x_001604 [Pirellulaceae bacterium SH501]